MSDVKRAVVYLRVSTFQQERDGVSLDAQLEMARRFCEYRGLELVGTYTDVMSGRDDRRPELARLEAAIASRQFDAVLVYKVDRLSRDAAHYHGLLKRFNEHDVRLASLTQDIDATTSFGKFVMAVLIAAAEMEADQTADRVRDSYRQRAEMGRPLMGGPATIGYRYIRRHINEQGHRVPGRIEIDVAQAAIVRWFFERFLDVRNIHQLVVEATAQGYAMPSGRPFNRQGVYRILRNPLYRGEYVALKTRTERIGGKRKCIKLPRDQWFRGDRTMPAIVDDEMWDRAQAILDENAKEAPRRVASRTQYPWTGLLRCEGCGGTLVRNWSPGHKGKKGVRLYLWQCHRTRAYGPDSCKVKARVAEAFLDKRTWPAIVAALDPIVTASRAGRPLKRGRPPKAARNVEQDLAALRAKLERIQAAFEDGDYGDDLATARRIKREKQAEVKAAIEALQAASKGPMEAPDPPRLAESLGDAWKRLESDPGARGQLLRALVHTIVVRKGALRIQFVETNHPEWPNEIELPITVMNSRHARNRDL